MSEIREALTPYSLSPIPGPKPHSRKGTVELLLGVRPVPDLGLLTTSIAGNADTPIIQRTWGLFGGSTAYGPNFQFSPYMRARNYFTGVLLHIAVTLLPIFLALKPIRMLLKTIVTAPGEGPDKVAQGKERIEYRAVAVADVDGPAVKRAYCRAQYSGGMYYRKLLHISFSSSLIN